ncbi:MAG: hypothetical protein V3R98_01110 [Alphaproteobacteria bacterium]
MNGKTSVNPRQLVELPGDLHDLRVSQAGGARRVAHEAPPIAAAAPFVLDSEDDAITVPRFPSSRR